MTRGGLAGRIAEDCLNSRSVGEESREEVLAKTDWLGLSLADAPSGRDL